ncbi:hypothetical protein FY034_06815 [Trichlorobacter lovleyi]|uniref:hypothetical protein n=1 Tax=Trichlorobacter lovleyi TaxID=313985 RepID=UPI00223F4EB5|nr:hypothetical protein [Trichlorobacter lovleyi]QOX78646.1 hypothetical protein FY034_06815 [Trichlorobacter lovleyi]
MQAPVSYADWSRCLDFLAEGLDDEGVLAAMEQGSVSSGGTVVQLLSERLCTLFDQRLTRCSDRLNRDLRCSRGEADLIRAMLDMRRGLTLLYKVSLIRSLPQTLREYLQQQLRRSAERTQQALEESSADDRSGHTRTLIRNNSLLRYDTPLLQPLISSTPPQPLSNQQPGAPRKRNILV